MRLQKFAVFAEIQELKWIIGDILMLSEGRNGLDNVYSLKNGTQLLQLPKKN